MEIRDSHWNKSYLFGFVKWGWPTLNTTDWTHFCSIFRPKENSLFNTTTNQARLSFSFAFLLRFLLRQLNQSGIITVCAFQRLSTFNALNWILSTGYWIYSQVYIVWALRQHNRPFQRWNQNTVIESTVDTHENPIINEKIGAKVDVIKYM